MKKLNLNHINRDMHIELAEHLQAAQKELTAATRIVQRAPYTDETLRAMRKIQESLIDPLREEWNDRYWDGENPYPSVGYAVR